MKIQSASAIVLVLLLSSIAHADHPIESVAIDASSTSCHIESNLGVGSRGEEVHCLQNYLITEGLLTSSATGYYGDMTKAAVVEWQRKQNIPTTGYFGPLSRGSWKSGGTAMNSHTTLAESPIMPAHPPLDVSSWPSVPSVTITLHPDAMSGYNLEIRPENFRFAPEHVNGTVVPNEGHAHIMINGIKLARVYGPWFHIPKEALLGEGEREVVVTLNANDHSDLSQAGVRIEARQQITHD